MGREKAYAVAIGFLGTLLVAALAYAYTQDQIWNAVYDSATTSLKVVVTP